MPPTTVGVEGGAPRNPTDARTWRNTTNRTVRRLKRILTSAYGANGCMCGALLSTIAGSESRWQRLARRLAGGLLLATVIGLAWVTVDEVHSSRRQAARLAALDRDLRFELGPGP